MEKRKKIDESIKDSEIMYLCIDQNKQVVELRVIG